ncbi:MAG: hypothetical protein V4625_09925 [Pseudomonadota bacterium]
MRAAPPHPLIRYRHGLLVAALAGWAVAAITLVQFKGRATFPVGTVVGLAALVFIWCCGAYWWIMLRYPYIAVGEGKYASRDEWKGKSHAAFLVGYFVVALLASVACIRVAING